MSEGNLVLVCGRYDAIGNEDKDAYLYGIARTTAVDGQCYFYDADSDWYGLKRHARIQRIEQSLPRSLIARALGIRAIVPTIQELDRNGFVRLEKLLRRELGIVVNV